MVLHFGLTFGDFFGQSLSFQHRSLREQWSITTLIAMPAIGIQEPLGSVISIDRGSRVPAAAALSASTAAISITDRMPSASDPLMITSAATRSASLALESAGSMTKLPCAA